MENEGCPQGEGWKSARYTVISLLENLLFTCLVRAGLHAETRLIFLLSLLILPACPLYIDFFQKSGSLFF